MISAGDIPTVLQAKTAIQAYAQQFLGGVRAFQTFLQQHKIAPDQFLKEATNQYRNHTEIDVAGSTRRSAIRFAPKAVVPSERARQHLAATRAFEKLGGKELAGLVNAMWFKQLAPGIIPEGWAANGKEYA